MSDIRKLFHITTRQRLPRLRHHLTSGRHMDEEDEEVQILMEAGLMRDWTSARSLVQRTGKTPLELFWELSKQRRADWRKRLQNWLIGLSGAYTFNPHASELRELEWKGGDDSDIL